MNVLRTLDDMLFDRVFQPIVDFAAPFDVKARHLSSAAYLLSGSISYFRHESLLPLGLIFCAVLAYLTLHWPGGERLRYDRMVDRILGLGLTALLSLLPPSLGMLAFCLAIDSAVYFRACKDNPPKRRWWKEIKRAIEVLTWAPELQPAGGEQS